MQTTIKQMKDEIIRHIGEIEEQLWIKNFDHRVEVPR